MLKLFHTLCRTVILTLLVVGTSNGYEDIYWETPTVAAALSCNISADEMIGLESLFTSTNGPNWINQQSQDIKSKWRFPSPLSEPCSAPWYGLTCTAGSDDRCQIAEIVLMENNLVGTLPTEIGLFTNLLELSLDGNGLERSIPSEIGQLVALEELSLIYNLLNGPFPTELFLLTRLRVLDLSNNFFFSDLPSEIGQLALLEELQIEEGYLHGSLPTTLGNLLSVKEIVLYQNSFTGPLPTELGMLSMLEALEMDTNSFTQWIPFELSGCIRLTYLSLTMNSLSGPLPTAALLSLPAITQIDVQLNHLTGNINLNLSNAHPLAVLELSNNPFTGAFTLFAPENSSLTALGFSECLFSETLLINVLSAAEIQIVGFYNYFSGPLPQIFGPYDSVDILELDNNFFSSTLSTRLGNFSYLEELDVSFNLLSGTIPSEMGLLSGLQTLSVGNNHLNGSVPEEIFDIYSLSSLSLNNNDFVGTISPRITHAHLLVDYDASYNHFTGPLPSRIGNSEVSSVSLNNNWLTGPVPPDIVITKYGTELLLYANQLTGTVDFLIVSKTLNGLAEVLIGSNLFTGPINGSTSMQLPAIEVGLDYNFLTGQIVGSIFSADVEAFLINSNFFSGTLPEFPNYDMATFVAGSNFFNGTIPISYVKLDSISTLDLSNNDLTGSLPSLLLSIKSSETIILANNSLTGRIDNIRIGEHLSQLDLSYNRFNGSVPHYFGKELSTLSLQANYFTGELNVDCASAGFVNTLLVGSNFLRGNLSNLACFQNLTILSLENNSFTGALDVIEKLPLIEQIVVNDNQLTGTLPSALSTFSQLKALIVANNGLIGQPGNVFNASGQTLLTAIDLSSNDFTGTIPDNIFHLPNLESFASIKTCFSGSIPSSLCGCSTLKVLLMDGVTSGLSCQKKFNFVPSSDAYISEHGSLEGGIPDCIWTNLPLLTSLHLSSNGLTGTLGTPPSWSNLTSIVLSYNQLSGTIPPELLSLPYTTLELSNNRLKGMVDGLLAKSDAVVYLQNNRLSGYLPSSFVNGSQISVMEGNLIDCDRHHPKPEADSHSAETSCGSSALDDALIVWAVLAAAILLLFLVVGLLLNFSSGNGRLVSQIELLLRMVAENVSGICRSVVSLVSGGKIKITPLQTRVGVHACDRYISCLQGMLSFQVVFFILVSVMLCVPIYLTLKLVNNGEYSTHTYQYQWLLSATFLTGIPAAVCVMFLWATSVLLFVRTSLTAYLGSEEPSNRESNSSSPLDMAEKGGKLSVAATSGSRLLRVVGCTLFAIVHFVLMTLVNIVYLYIILSGRFSVNVMTLAQVSVSIAKVLWDSFLIPRGLRALQWLLGEQKGSAASSGVRSWSDFVILKFTCSVLSSIVIPFIVSLFVNSLCFLDLFVPQSVVNENFFYNVANKVECITVHIHPVNITTPSGQQTVQPPDMSDCLSFGSVQDYSTEFYPPFTYSFQCGSGVLTSYVPVLIYSFAFRLLSLVVLKGWKLWLDRGRDGDQGDGNVIQSSLVTDSEQRLNKRLHNIVRGGQMVASSMLCCLVLLTFGLSSPYLAGIVIFSAVLEVSWHCTQLVDLTAKGDKNLNWDREMGGLWEIPRRCTWPCIHLASVFWALMVFDMIGDTDVLHPRRAWWGPFVICVFPCIVRVWLHIRSTMFKYDDHSVATSAQQGIDERMVKYMTESVDNVTRGSSAASLSMKLLSSSDDKSLTYYLRDEHNSKF